QYASICISNGRTAMVLKRVGVLSAAKIAGVLYAGLGLIFGAIFALAALVGAGFAQAAAQDEGLPAFFGLFFGCGAIVFVPVMYGLLGAIMAAVMAALYNVFAGIVGGLELQLE
ncbi:MAG: hypothetical protein ACREI7_11445, partial [Myxococcota bacterium]